MEEFTSYTLIVDNVLDLGSVTVATDPLRQMNDLTATFVTGAEPEVQSSAVAFDTEVLIDGFADGGITYTSITMGPDGRLYICTLNGEIHRWSLNDDGSIDESSLETLTLDYFDAGTAGRRGIIGMEFDPENPNVLWVTDNAPVPRESASFSSPEFSGQISKITFTGQQDFDSAQAQTYISGLPRSGGDHVTNSIEFRANPDAGQPGEPNFLLYLTQGSNSAGGAADAAWGLRRNGC